MADVIREAVRARYAKAASSISLTDTTQGCGCSSPSCCDTTEVFGAHLYGESVEGAAPDRALLASLGCGNPTAVADLREGETVLDLGSGAGLDVLLSAKRVGPTGKAVGLDMTEEMLDLARRNARDAGANNVEFLKGYIESIPLPEESVDVVISNCVINLSADKTRVFDEVFRVLRRGGRIGMSDVVLDDPTRRGKEFDAESWSACLSGALTRSEYQDGLRHAGFVDVELTDSHVVGDGYVSTIVRARKPLDQMVKGGDV
ncbi:MAG TPA: arsenite methyltransferase [Actinomycetota bacterium]|jgi:SAM-dependent methyltransferase